MVILVNKEKISIISLENKTEKYILYSNQNLDENNINKNLFEKMEFNENLSITPKKKLTDLCLNVSHNSVNNKYILSINNNIVYYLKDTKNIVINDPNLKLILQNGKFFSVAEKSISNNIVDDILNKKILEIKDEKTPTQSQFNKIFDIIKIDEHKNNNENSILSQVLCIKENKVIEKQLSESEVESVLEPAVETEVETVLEPAVETEVESVLDPTVESVLEHAVETEVESVLDPTVESVLDPAVESVLEHAVETEVEPAVETEVESVLEHAVETEVESVSETAVESIIDNIEEKNIKKIEIIEKTCDIENSVSNFEIKKIDYNNIPIESKVSNQISQLSEEQNNLKKIEIKNITEDTILSQCNKIEIKKINSSEDKDKNLNESVSSSENKDLYKDVFNLENILSDFNKLFNLETLNKNEHINSETNAKESTKSNDKEKSLINNSSLFSGVNSKIIPVIYQKKINYQNIFYKINTQKLNESLNLNFSNLNKEPVPYSNIIIKTNIAFELDIHNSSYLIMYMNQKYLINKINNSIVLTNMSSKNSQIIKNKDTFKFGMYDFVLYNDSTLLIPMIQKKIFDNNYGVAFNTYIPRI